MKITKTITNQKNNENNNEKKKLRQILEKVKLIKNQKKKKKLCMWKPPHKLSFNRLLQKQFILLHQQKLKLYMKKYQVKLVYVNAPATKCKNEDIKLFGMNTKESTTADVLNKILSNKTYKQASLIFILLTLFALLVTRRYRY